MTKTTYSEIYLQSTLKSGDAIFVYPQAKSSLLDKFISFWENPFGEAPFHCGIIIRERGAIFILQADPDGVYQVPLKYYKNNKLHIFQKGDNAVLDTEWAEDFFKHIKYSYLGAGVSAIAEYIPDAKELDITHKKFCSQAVIDVFKHMGFKFNNDCVNPYQLLKYFSWLGLNELEVIP